MEANGGKISNWSGILMAATPALGEFEALQSTAEMVEAYGDYASPWLNMAEKAINGETIHSEDYLMAVGNTLSTAIDTNTSYLGDTLSKIGAKTAVAGAMYLSDKETADTYFNEMVGQEVGSFLAGYAGSQMSGFTGEKDSQGFKAGMAAASGAITAGISSYASTFVSNRMGGMSARDSFSEAYDGLGSSMMESIKSGAAQTSRTTAARADIFGMAMDAATNTQRMDFGNIKNFQIVDELNDGEDKAYGAFDSATGKVMVSRELVNQAQTGDKDASAHLLGLLKEELSHREAQAAEQALNIKDYPYDEGALAARQMLKALGEHDGRTVFTFNANDESFDFETSADAINKAVDDKFGWGRILSDRQSGSLEFNSGNTANDALSNENLAAMLAQNPDFEMKSAEEQQGMIDQLRQSTNSYYDGVMDQAVTDGSLATYMLAAGAQGLANVGLGITDIALKGADSVIGSGLYVGDKVLTAAVDVATLVTDHNAIFDLEARTDEVIANGYLPKGEELSYRMANEIHSRALGPSDNSYDTGADQDKYVLRLDARVIGNWGPVITPFPLDSLKVHGTATISDRGRIHDGDYDFHSEDGSLYQEIPNGADLVKSARIYARNKLNEIAYPQHDPNGKAFHIEYTYNDNDLIYGRRNFAPWSPDVDPDYADPYSDYLNAEAERQKNRN